MKVRDEHLITHTGNMQPIESRRMGIDMNSVAHIIKQLTDLYSDKEHAVLQEYATNAYDSHVEAGQTRPIEVELPSDLKPVFVVRDFGVGLSMEDLIETYGLYGRSTKRDTNDAVGMLGFGCKAALTYTNQFTVRAVKNGVKTTALITRGEDGVGSVDIIDTCASNEHNGVEVTIPAKAPIAAFNAKAKTIYGFWEPGTILVNNQVPESFFGPEDANNLALDPDIRIIKEGLAHDYVVMGNVGYPTELGAGLRGAHVVARVGIGDVSFVPSREALQMDARTKEVCAEITVFVAERIIHHVNREIEKQPDRKSVIAESIRWDQIVFSWRKRPRWRGEEIPPSLDITGQSWKCGWYRNTATKQSYIRLDELVDPGVFVMLHHPHRSMDKETKETIKKEFPTAQAVYVVWAIKGEHKPWLEAAQIIDYNDIKPPPMMRGPRAKSNKYEDGGGRWLVWYEGAKFRTEDIPTTSTDVLVYALKSEGSRYLTRDRLRSNLGDVLTNSGRPFKFVIVGKGDEERFKKLHPNATHFQQYFQLRTDEILGTLTDDQIWWGTDTYDRRKVDWILNLDAKKILDPDTVALLDRLKAAASAPVLNAELLLIVQNSGRISGTSVRVRNFANPDGLVRLRASCDGLVDAFNKWQKRYPLCSTTDPKATVEYLNAVYLYRKGDCK